jgi:hypothetical protein
MRRALTLGGFFYLLLVYLTYFLYSTGASADAFKHAVQQKSIEQLDQYIDYKAVQSSIKQQLKIKILSEASVYQSKGENEKPVSFLEMTQAIKIIEDYIDSYITREGSSKLFQWLAKDNHENSKISKAKKYLTQLQSDQFINFRHWHFTLFNSIETMSYDQDGREYKLVFTFDGLRWVITDVILNLQDIDSKKIVSFIEQFRGS